MPRYAIMEKATGRVVSTYTYHRKKELKIENGNIQFEMLVANGAAWDYGPAYSWDGTSIVFDNTVTRPVKPVRQENPFELSSSDEIQTTSEDYAVMSSMTCTPTKGKYTCVFSAQADNDSNEKSWYALFKNGIRICERIIESKGETPLALVSSVSSNGDDVFSIMYKTKNDNEITVTDRKMIFILGD